VQRERPHLPRVPNCQSEAESADDLLASRERPIRVLLRLGGDRVSGMHGVSQRVSSGPDGFIR